MQIPIYFILAFKLKDNNQCFDQDQLDSCAYIFVHHYLETHKELWHLLSGNPMLILSRLYTEGWTVDKMSVL